MNIWNSYIWNAEWRIKCKEDPRSYQRNLCSCEKKAWFFQAFFSQLHKLRWWLRGSSLHLIVMYYNYSMLPSFRTGPVFVQKELYLIIFVGHSNLRQQKNSKSKRNILAINCRCCWVFWLRSRSVRTISFEVSKGLAANICTFHCTVKVF